MTHLRQRMIGDLRTRNYSPRTVTLYMWHVARFAAHLGRSPDQLGPDEIREYLVLLVETKRVSWSYFKQVVNALRFLYRVSLDRGELVPHIPFARTHRRLPTILSAEETTQLLCAIPNPKHRAILMTAYAAALRVSEVVTLKVADIDSQRNVRGCYSIVRPGPAPVPRSDPYPPVCGHTPHAEEEMSADGYSIPDLERAVLDARILDRQRDTDTSELKYVIRGPTFGERDIELVAKRGPTGTMIIITV